MPGIDDILTQADALVRQGRPAQAKALLARAAQRADADPRAVRELGFLLFAQGQMDQGLYHLERAAKALPRDLRTLCCLGTALAARGGGGAIEAIAVFERAVAEDPLCVAALGGLGLLLQPVDRYDEALAYLQRAVEASPSAAGMRANLAMCLLDMGRPEDSLATLREGLLASPSDPGLRAALPIVMNYLADPSPMDLFAAHARFGESLPGEDWTGSRDRDPDRRLRIGVLSPDLREHSVAYFAEALLAGLDRAAFEVVALPLNRTEDARSARLRAHADAWRPVGPLGIGALVRELRSMNLDILLDLAGLTSGHRAEALARRVAPVQCTLIGYPATTGIPAMDYRIVDAHTDPPTAGPIASGDLASERLVRLPRCFLCYTPPQDAPAVTPPPSAADRPITFGSFNALKKINDRTLDAWAAAMHAVPGSRLVLKSLGLATTSVRDSLLGRLRTRGIDPSRLETLARVANPGDHLRLYERIDLALDTFPYHGTTTTCEALWMGVPVVSLTGRVHAARVGLSLLHAIGHPEWAGESIEEFARIAATLASDRPRLSALRLGLREAVRQSPLCDAVGYGRRMSQALRAMWRAWCADPKQGGRSAFATPMSPSERAI